VLRQFWLGNRKGIRPVKKLGVGLLMVTIRLELCMYYSCSCQSPPLSSLAPAQSRMEMFCYWLIQIHLENVH